MQKIVLEKPYVHVPPLRGTFWPSMVKFVLPSYLRRQYGIVSCQYDGLDRLRASHAAGDGILLMPNHCRDEDGLVMGQLSCKIGLWFYYMVSRHLMEANGFQAFLLPRAGAFSVFREGTDRASVKTAVHLLAEDQRPVVIFPEGYLGRTNDRLNPLMDGAALIARAAAKIRSRRNPPGRVVVHPVALRYHLAGPLEPGVAMVLAALENALGLSPGVALSIHARVDKIEAAMLAKWEKEYLNQSKTGSLTVRRHQLIQSILEPLELEWQIHHHEKASMQARVRQLRAVILHDLMAGGLSESERQHCWQQLRGVYLALALDNYPPDYLSDQPPPERLLETIERLQEDLTDRITPYVPLIASITVGEAIVVNPLAAGRGATDPLLSAVEAQLRKMLGLSHINLNTAASQVAPH